MISYFNDFYKLTASDWRILYNQCFIWRYIRSSFHLSLHLLLISVQLQCLCVRPQWCRTWCESSRSYIDNVDYIYQPFLYINNQIYYVDIAGSTIEKFRSVMLSTSVVSEPPVLLVVGQYPSSQSSKQCLSWSLKPHCQGDSCGRCGSGRSQVWSPSHVASCLLCLQVGWGLIL